MKTHYEKSLKKSLFALTLAAFFILGARVAFALDDGSSPETQHAQAAALTDGVDASKAGTAESVAASGGSISDKLSAASASLRTLRPAKPRPPAPRTAPTCSKADWLKKLKAVALIALMLGILIPAVSSGVSSYKESVRKDACLTVMQAVGPIGGNVGRSQGYVDSARNYLDALANPESSAEELHRLYIKAYYAEEILNNNSGLRYGEGRYHTDYKRVERAERTAANCSETAPQAVADARKAVDHLKNAGSALHDALAETDFWKYSSDPVAHPEKPWRPDPVSPEAIARARAHLERAQLEVTAAQKYSCSLNGEFRRGLYTTEGEWTVSNYNPDTGRVEVITDPDALGGGAETPSKCP